MQTTTTQNPTSLRDAQRWAESVVDAWNRQRETTVPPLVLLAEDDEAARDVLSEKLVADGFHVAAVSDGEEALQFLRRGLDENTEAYKPDLVISDIRMPRVSGLELMEEIRELAPLLPTILLTGFGDAHIRRHALKAGCDQVLFKPFDYEFLREHARRLLLTDTLVPEFGVDDDETATPEKKMTDWSPYH